MELHPIQKKILFDLLFSSSLRYTDVKPLDMDPSQFLFHLKQLRLQEFVEKNAEGSYILTNKGKEFANRIDVASLEFVPQSKVTTVMCCVRKNPLTSEKEFLLYKRLKNPYFGCYGFPTQKVLFGQNITETVELGLKDETSLLVSTAPQLFAIRHYHILGSQGEVLEDKLMHAFLITEPSGDLNSNMEGEFFWTTSNEIPSLQPNQDEFEELYTALQVYNSTGALTFKEIAVVSKHF